MPPEGLRPEALSGRRGFLRRSSTGLAALACLRTLGAAAEHDRTPWDAWLRQPWTPPARLDSCAGRRPRLFLTPEQLVRVRQFARTSHAAIWAMVQEKAAGYLGRLPPADYEKQQDMRESGRGLPWQALAYLVSGDNAFLVQAKRWLRAVCDFPHWEQDHSLAGGECLFGVALAYDWLYQHLTDSERAQVRAKLVRQAQAMQAGPPVHHDVWLANHNHVEHTGLAAAGFALFDEVPEAIAWIRQADLVYREFLRHASDDGSSSEGHQYWAYTTESALRYFELARALLGTDYYDHPWLQGVAAFIIHSILPDFNRTQCVMTFGDAGRNFASHGPTHLLYRVAAEYRDRHAQWLALEMDRRGVGRGDFCTWANLLWYDPTLAPAPLERRPVLGRADDIGWVTTRSGWQADAVMVGFKCGPMHGHKAQALYEQSRRDFPARPRSIGGGHGHPDVNSFQIYAYGKWLAIDPGYERPKATRTHNTIVVNGHGQLGEGATWFDRDAVLRAGAKSSLVHCESRPEFDYVVGDAMTIYPPAAGLTGFRRHVLFLKPAVVVIVDELQVARPSTVAWFLHTERAWRPVGEGTFAALNGDVEMDAHFLPAAQFVPTIAERTLTLAVAVAARAQLVAVLYPRRRESQPLQANLIRSEVAPLALALAAGSRRLRVELDPDRLHVVTSG